MRMFIHHRTCFAGRAIHKLILVALVSAFSLTCVFPAAAQKEKKKKTEPAPSTDSSKTLVSLSDEQQIDYTLSEMLGAWQLGDVETLHKDYADDVAVVNGSWAPPVLGWTNYLAIYQQQRARMQQVRMDRFNTYIKVSGAVGWACYQWEFAGVLDGQQTESQGQTTVVLEKRNNHWVIVLNHTSLAPRLPQATPASAPPRQAQPTKPTPR
jgi:ketosteroid isomerase-like protein